MNVVGRKSWRWRSVAGVTRARTQELVLFIGALAKKE
ncbi:hypothetical protein PI125_g17110 [Phytophthora idaei]|nr:hypothetical protein PI125_g17110 [Phytophthora idaei]